MTILITGFGDFDGGSNASQRLVEAIAKKRAEFEAAAGDHIATRVLPVDTIEAPAHLQAAITDLRPRFVLLCGQAAGRNRVCLETLAVNRRDFSQADIAGRLIAGECVRVGGADALAATWPDPAGTVQALLAAGIPAVLSRDAGTYLCNQLLYEALSIAPAAGIAFLHVPVLPEQVAAGEPGTLRHAACPFMPLDMTLRAAAIVLSRTTAYGEMVG